MKKVLSILALAIVIVSCSKSKDDVAAQPQPAQPTVVGFWKGTYGGNTPFAITFRADGTMRVYANNADTAQASKAEGSYALNEAKTAVNGYYTYLNGSGHYTMTTSLNKEMTQINGQYLKTGTAITGTFSLTK